MRDPFKPRVSVPLAHSMNPALKEAEAEAGRAAQRLAQWRHEEEQARLLNEARVRTTARKGKTK